jgi:small subunit ribosomal protein S20
MPVTKSALKALRSSQKKRKINLARKFKIKSALKDFRKSVSGEVAVANQNLSKVFSQLDKAVKSKLLKRNTADRKKSRLSKLIAKSN